MAGDMLNTNSKKALVLLSISFFLFLSLHSFAAPPKSKPRVDIKELEMRIHDLINLERQKAGLRPLELDKRLSIIARGHSQDMAQRNYFNHISPEGENPLMRYKKNGYVCRNRVGRYVIEGGENIFQNNLYNSIRIVNGREYYDWNSMEDIARSTVKGWMGSPGHRKNILRPAYRSEGIGVSIKKEKVYITQNFC